MLDKIVQWMVAGGIGGKCGVRGEGGKCGVRGEGGKCGVR